MRKNQALHVKGVTHKSADPESNICQLNSIENVKLNYEIYFVEILLV